LKKGVEEKGKKKKGTKKEKDFLSGNFDNLICKLFNF